MYPFIKLPGLREKEITKLKNRLVHGDSLAHLRSLPDGVFAATITDPPYCSGGQTAAERSRPTTTKYQQTGQALQWPEFEGDTMDQRSWSSWCREWLAEARRVTKVNGVLCVFTDWRQLPATTDVIQQAGWKWLGIVPWDKTPGCRPAIGRFRNQAEYIVWACNRSLPYDRGVPALPGVYRHVVEKPGAKRHLTGKPIALMRDLLKIVEPGGAVLDPFAGSATTLVAAHELGHPFYGLEASREYYEIARNRLLEVGALDS